MNPVFGWGNECRFSWGTAKDLLETKGSSINVDWPADDDDQGMRVTDFFSAAADHPQQDRSNGLTTWFGTHVSEEVF